MKNTIANFLLVLFLFSALVPAQAKEELAKLPDLIDHYKVHQAAVPNTSFFQFWRMHYSEAFAQHQADHDHSKLPGKAHCNHLHATMLVACQNLPDFLPVRPTSDGTALPIYEDQSYQFSLLMDIWQPPRPC